MKKNRMFILLLVFFSMGIPVAVPFVLADTGAKEMVLNKGNNKGEVLFPHYRHQQTLKDCTICHQLFPQKKDAVAAYIKDGQLEKKEVMKHCLKCHRQMSTAGKKTGPTRCNACHQK